MIIAIRIMDAATIFNNENTGAYYDVPMVNLLNELMCKPFVRLGS